MLNFTGQTKRRNVNLGNKSGRTKQELLNEARKERERRALIRRNEENAVIIQSAIRRYESSKSSYTAFINNLDQDIARSLIIAYPISIFHTLGEEVTQRVLNCVTNEGQYVLNLRITRLLSELGTRECSETFINTVLSKLVPINPPKAEYVQSIIKLLTSATYEFSAAIMSHIVQLVHDFNIWESQLLTLLFSIPIEDSKVASNIRQFLQLLSKTCPPQDLSEDTSSRHLVDNLAYIYTAAVDSAKPKLADAVLKSLKPFRGLVLGHCPHFSGLYTRSFVDVVMRSSSDGFYDKMSDLISQAPDVDRKNNVLIALLAKPGALSQAYNEAIEKNSEMASKPKNALLLVEMLNLYLSVASDYEILHNVETFPLQYLQKATVFLKNVCFENLWDESGCQEVLADCYLSTLKKIHLRDSRLHFCSQNNKIDFWSVLDEGFLNVNITNYIKDYESFYRDHLNAVENENDEKGYEDSMKRSDLRRDFLSAAQVSFSNRPTTRQYRKLNILFNAPFYIPFQQRVDWLYLLISLDHQRLDLSQNGLGSVFSPWNMRPNSDKQNATISRENLLEDAFAAYNPIGESFKSKLSITFVNEFGPEAGIDGGGITKEFLTSITDKAFKDDKYQLFKHNKNHEIYPASNLNDSVNVNYVWFLGKVLGKCLYDHVLVDVTFADFFLKKLLNFNNSNSSFDDLASLDPDLYSNLAKLLVMNSDELQALGLLFEITDEDTHRTVELVPNGSSLRVDKSNVLHFLLAVSDFKLNKKLRVGTRAFTGGLYTMIPPHWIEMFNSAELQMLISGGGKDIDLEDLQNNTEYGDYTYKHQTIKDFWEILAECSPEDRLKFVKFVTSVPRAPLQGFGSLSPRFGIRNAGQDTSRLPTASTCVNLLKLPDYRNKELLRAKLLYAINAEARFDLS